MQLFPPALLAVDGARALQSAVVLPHVLLHWPLLALHWYAPHETGLPAWQLPLPSQVGAGTCASDSEAALPFTVPAVGAAQVALPQTVSAAVSWQPPAPLHFPVLPQVEPAAHVVLSRGEPPTAMLLHVPGLEASEQLWQAPLQATLQQTPSLQTLLLQSELALQLCPLASLSPHRLLTLRHVSPDTQSASDVHVVRHDGLVPLHR